MIERINRRVERDGGVANGIEALIVVGNALQTVGWEWEAFFSGNGRNTVAEEIKLARVNLPRRMTWFQKWRRAVVSSEQLENIADVCALNVQTRGPVQLTQDHGE